MKTIAMKTLLVFFAFAAAMTLLTPTVFAVPGVSIKAIRVEGLGNQRGKYITAFYAVGSAGAISTQRDQMNLRAVKERPILEITGDSVTFPPIPVLTWNGNQMPYNFIVFAIHSEKEIVWLNADGSIPQGPQTGAQVLPLYVDSLTAKQVKGLTEATQDNTITHTFNFSY